MTISTFKPKYRPAPRVWKCDCGCENFWLYEDGRIECAECLTFHHSRTGFWKIVDLNAPLRHRVRQPDGSYVEEGPDEGAGESPEGDARVQDGGAAQRLEEGAEGDQPQTGGSDRP